jgi:hypothetical protein
MVYKYGPKLLPFVSVFHEGIQISLKSLWRQILQENSKEQMSKKNFFYETKIQKSESYRSIFGVSGWNRLGKSIEPTVEILHLANKLE